MTYFGERLKELRQLAGWSQSGLAEKSGVPIGTIRDYEQGRRDPLLLTAARLARAINQPLEALVDASAIEALEKPADARVRKPGRGRPKKESIEEQAGESTPAKGAKKRGRRGQG